MKASEKERYFMVLADSISINLNFLLFIRNLSLPADGTVFPNFPMNRDAFLPSAEFDFKAKEIWDSILVPYKDDCTDCNDWSNRKFTFEALMKDHNCAQKYLPVIRDCFEAWFFLNWKPLVELYSMQIVDRCYSELVDFKIKNHKEPLLPSLFLGIVFTAPPSDWMRHNRNYFVLTCESEITNRQKIGEQLKAMCFETGQEQ